MLRYIIRRILLLIPVILGVILVVYSFQAISDDDPVVLIMGGQATEEQLDAKRAELGLDKPVLEQYVIYVYNMVFHGDLGKSYITGQSISGEIAIRYPYTIKLALGSVALGVLLGIPLGVLSAVMQYTWVDSAILFLSVFIASFPAFWMALLLIVLFAVKLGWLPGSGLTSWKSWVLPMVVIAIQAMVHIVRNTRSSMLESIRQDFVRTVRAKGQTERKVVIRHVLRNSLIPVVNTIGVSVGNQLGGALIIENIFGIPGIGSYAISAINNRNYAAVLGSVVVLAITFSVLNLLLDICYVVIDPRLKTTFQVVSKRKLKAQNKEDKAATDAA